MTAINEYCLNPSRTHSLSYHKEEAVKRKLLRSFAYYKLTNYTPTSKGKVIFGFSNSDGKTCWWVQEKAKVTDIIERIKQVSWVGHTARRQVNKKRKTLSGNDSRKSEGDLKNTL